MIDKNSRQSKNSSTTDNSSTQSEQERLGKLYKFLLSLTDLGISEDSDARKLRGQDGAQIVRPNETFIAAQWGLDTYRIFVRRVLVPLYPKIYEDSRDKDKGFPGIDLQRLVTILVSLDKYKRGQQSTRKTRLSNQSRAVLTHADRTKALRLFSELSVTEREQLGWKTSIKDKLLSQLTEKLSDPSFSISEPLLREIYTLTLREDPVGNNDSQLPRREADSLNRAEEKITREVEKILKENLFTEDDQGFRELVSICAKKVNQEIDRILVQSGEQFVSISNTDFQKRVGESRKSQLYNNSFVSAVVYSVVHNYVLTREFPIFLRYIEMKRLRPLPLRIYSKDQPDGLLNENLIISENSDAEVREMQGLSEQTAYKVKLFFYIEVIEEKDGGKIRKLKPFYDEEMGIGSPISLATAIINRLILSDLECLKEKGVFPIAKQILLSDRILGDRHSSPIWSHSIVQLCNIDIVKRSIEKFERSKDSEDAYLSIADQYNSIDSFGEAASGDACGFDLLEVVVKSGLSARLHAIKKLGIDAGIYMQQLSEKLKEIEDDRKATSYFRSYPLSFWAMEGTLEEKLLIKYRTRTFNGGGKEDEIFFQNEVRNKSPWSHLAYNAHLKLAEYSLLEGKTSRARIYLDVVDTEEHQENMSAFLRARLAYTKAYYFYLYNLDSNPDKISRLKAVRRSEQFIEEAKQFLQQIVKECYAIDELAFTNPHAFFSILGRIKYLEACIILFFGDEIGVNEKDKAKNLETSLSSFQDARICAAKAGNYNDYACFSSIQSWCFLMTDYLSKDEYRFSKISNSISCSTGKTSWSNQLMKHSMICYGEIGEKCYMGIKGNTGQNIEKTEEDKNKKSLYGSTSVEGIGLIREIEDQDSAKQEEIIKLKINLLLRNVKMGEESDVENVFLFGPFSSIILFALGINQLIDENFSLLNKESSSKSPDDQIEIIDDSVKLFIMSLSIAQDGDKGNKWEKDQETESKIIISRNFEYAVFDAFKVSNIRGLYPCRISQIIPLSAIGMIAGTLLKLIYIKPLYSASDWEELMKYMSMKKDNESQTAQTFPTVIDLSEKSKNRIQGIIDRGLTGLKLEEMFSKYKKIEDEEFDGKEKEIDKDNNRRTRNLDFNDHLSAHVLKAMEYLNHSYNEVRSSKNESSPPVIRSVEDLSAEFSKNKENLFRGLFPIILGTFK
jgi:hypothetical protein